MQPNENDELTDRELDAILTEWKSPRAPASLRAAVFPDGPKPWWKTMWSASVRIPVPVAACLAILLALSAWRWLKPVTPRVGNQLQPVAELRPRIIRVANAQN